jgi:uncharacterized protein YnzC (UPF0291/DUF896 family)
VEDAKPMITEETIRRINELANKKKTVGLTEAEAQEQQELRRLYLQGIRASLRNQLDRIQWVDGGERAGQLRETPKP